MIEQGKGGQRITNSMVSIGAVNSEQHQSIKYSQDTIIINGEIVFDSKGLRKKEITNFEPYIKGLQYIGDNNEKYFLVNITKE